MIENPVQEIPIGIEAMITNLEKVIIGKRSAVELAVLGLVCQGHILIEDVPGVGKTVLAKSIARTIGCSFNRIQFTPDMLPSDVTGVSVYNQKTKEFEFRSGPIMAQIVLADEINRATPKTQSALLEAMEEHQITVDGITHKLPAPFMILATQNPIEYEGTFPLLEAQMDRFLLRIRLGYPGLQDEIKILESQQIQHPLESLTTIISSEELQAIQAGIKKVYLSDGVKKYIVELVRQTREHADVFLGCSPRGSLGLFRASQARAMMHGRSFVLPDDVKALAIPVLAHRIVVNPAARFKNITSEEIIHEIILNQPVPGGIEAVESR